MTTIKQVCLGVAVAGVVAGTGSAVATAVAYADSGSPDSQGSAKSSSSPSSTANAQSRKAPSKNVVTGPRRNSAVNTTTASADPAPSAAAKSAPAARRTIKPMRLAASLPLPAPLPTPSLPLAPAGAATTGSSYRTARSSGTTVYSVTNNVADPTNVHVLVVGVDGTNLRRVLAGNNPNFDTLMGDSVTGVASIVGHTTISNPSWTAILTGAWDNQTGVINNIFTADTYMKWPTVINQLEYYNSAIDTMVIADWKVITDIANAGQYPVDTYSLVPQVPGDANWSLTDAEVTAQTVAAITSADAPNFLFSYLVQVDEAGHQYGGGSTQYEQAINRTDTNIGDIMNAVATSGENWTVIVVTDHGHQPQRGFGHGFQSPDETSTWVIAHGADFDPGRMNLAYSIVDVTPTVLDLFGAPPATGSKGVSLTTLKNSDVLPVDLEQALNDAIARNGWPDIQTNVALSVRTIFASIPYFLDGGITSIAATLQGIVDQNIFLVSQLAAVSKVVVQVLGNATVSATSVFAELIALLTGVDIFSKGHPLPPPTGAAEPETPSVLVA